MTVSLQFSTTIGGSFQLGGEGLYFLPMKQNALRITVFTGPVDSGKTGRLKTNIRDLLSRGIHVGGVVSEALMSDGKKTGYAAVDIITGNRVILSSRDTRGGEAGTSFRFFREGFDTACRSILSARQCDVVVIDELGPLELKGGGFCGVFKELLRSFEGDVFLVIRDYLMEEILMTFDIRELVVEVIDCGLNEPVSFEPWS